MITGCVSAAALMLAQWLDAACGMMADAPLAEGAPDALIREQAEQIAGPLSGSRR